MQTVKKTMAIAILCYGNDEVLIVRRCDDHETWDFPGTKVAEGEREKEAAARVAQFVTGLDIAPERFGRVVRDAIGKDDIRRVSFRATLTDAERDELEDMSPCGTRMLYIARRRELPDFIEDRRRRAMMQA